MPVPASPGRLGALGAIEFLENLAQFLGIHPDALILHRKPQLVGLPDGTPR